MKKKLLTSMLGVLFLFFGTFVDTAEASTEAVLSIGELQQQKIKTIPMIELTNKYNKNISTIKKVCSSRRIDCGFFIQLSADAFDSMISACNYAETSSACANAQTWIEIVMEATLNACSMAKINQQKDLLPMFNRVHRMRESGV